MSSVDHIILYLLLIAVFYNFSKNNSKYISKDKFWYYALLPIVLYAFIEGSRYGRGVDYPAYKFRFEHINPLEETQLLFLWLMRTLKAFSFNYVLVFITYSFITITGTFYFIRKTFDNQERQWMFLFAFLSLTLVAESAIRQYIAQPFIFCAIPFMLEKKKWWIGIVLALIAVNIHTGVAVQIPALIISYYFVKKTLDWKIWIVVLFVSYYILPQGILSESSIQMLQMLNMGSLVASEHVLHYVEDADRWLGEGSVLEAAEQTFFTMSLQFMFESAVIFVCCKVLQKYPKQKIMFLFNIAVAGFILCRLFHGYEIFTRMFQQLYIYWFVPVGYAAYHIYRRTDFSQKERKLLLRAMFVLCIYQFMYWFRFVFLNPDATFFWNI